MQFAFHFNADRCAECFACEVACKSVNGLAPDAQAVPGSSGPRFRQVVQVPRPDAPAGACPVQYVSMACMHCAKPDCMAVCPAKAIYREPEFGAVLVDSSRCIGCRYCSWACEFGAPQFGEDGTMRKCTMCVDRLREGLQPACVENCCGGALTVGPVDAAPGDARKRAASKLGKLGA